MNIKFRKVLGKLSQKVFPSYSWCKRCNITWNLVEYHTVMYTENRGMFALCEDCWEELTPEERLPYYKELADSWDKEIDNLEQIILNES